MKPVLSSYVDCMRKRRYLLVSILCRCKLSDNGVHRGERGVLGIARST